MGNLAGEAGVVAVLMQRVEASNDLSEGTRTFAEKRQPWLRGA